MPLKWLHGHERWFERILFWRVRPEVGARFCAAVLRSYFICGERRHSSDWRKEALVETQRTCGVFCKLFCKPGFLRAEEEEAEGWGMNWRGRRRREKRRGEKSRSLPLILLSRYWFRPGFEITQQRWEEDERCWLELSRPGYSLIPDLI